MDRTLHLSWSVAISLEEILMRQPKELTQAELQQIARRVRHAMIAQGLYQELLILKPDVLEAFVRQTYIEVRTQLEQEQP